MSSEPKAPRATKQRTAIAKLLEHADAFKSAQELHDLLRAEGAGVGLATVYRTLQSLVDSGEIDVLRNESGEVIYKKCASSDHHHHLVCTHCGLSVEVESDAIEQWAERIAKRHGFTAARHTAEVFGRCETCSAG
jgi:Fur family ferric uptake transcriptional regulator